MPLATILIVDDHLPTLEQWAVLLANNLFKILTTSHGNVAFEMACDIKPDLILSDLDMPEVDGFELLTLLKSTVQTRDIPVIICSGTTDVTSKYLALTLGAIAYLEKPLDVKHFLDVIDEKCNFSMSVASI